MLKSKNSLSLKSRVLASLLAGVVVLGWSVAHAEEDVLHYEPHYRRIAMVMADGLPQVHLTHDPLDDFVSQKALDNFLSSLDHDRSYFLDEDVGQFRKLATRLDDHLKGGHLEFAYAVFEVFKERSRNRVEHVKKLLERGFDLEKKEAHAWKRKDAHWPRDQVEWNDLWRKKIKNEYLGHVVTRRLDDEEKSQEEKEASPDESDEKADTAEKPIQSPEELILKSYKQFESVLEAHDAEWVLQVYLNAFAAAYDVHSAYMSPRADEDFDIQMRLSLQGIGALLTLDQGAAKVVRLIAGGPAERDGRLEPGDKIVAVAQGNEEPVDILFWPLYKSVRLIRGEKGTEVVLNIIPSDDPTGTTVERIELVRDEIKLEERAAKSEVREVQLDDAKKALKLGVVTLPDFYADLRGGKPDEELRRSCSRDVKRLVEELQEEGVDGILLDLRNNGGGSLSDAIEMTGYFIKDGPIVQVKSGRKVRVHEDPDKEVVYPGPMVVLVNRMSASASEILAGALQDYERAIIVGDTRTHGKGSVQSVFALDRFNKDLGSMKITTAGFYRIDGRSTQLHGVEPDVVISSTLDVMEIGEEFLPNVLELEGIEAADYQKESAVKQYIPYLNQQSRSRRNESDRFATYAELMEHLREKNTMQEISLNLDDRLAMTRRDREFNEKLEQFRQETDEGSVDDNSETEEEKQAKDLILTEALYILRDLVAAGKQGSTVIGGQTSSAGDGV